MLGTLKKPLSRIPTIAELSNIDVADRGVFELNKKEVAKTRRLIYAINHDNICRYRTLLDGSLLLVWRIK
jgi:hypothetical protein